MAANDNETVAQKLRRWIDRILGCKSASKPVGKRSDADRGKRHDADRT